MLVGCKLCSYEHTEVVIVQLQNLTNTYIVL